MEFSKECIYGIEVKEGVAGVVGTFENADSCRCTNTLKAVLKSAGIWNFLLKQIYSRLISFVILEATARA